MWSRVDYADWQLALPVIGFILTAGAFLFFVVWALRMRQDKSDHAANLPLEGETHAFEPESETPSDRPEPVHSDSAQRK